MKNKEKGIAMIVLILIITIICILTIGLSVYIYKLNTQITDDVEKNDIILETKANNLKYEEYYVIPYKSTFATDSYLKMEEESYEIVKNYDRAKEIFKKISNKEYVNLFDVDFFENNNLIFFEGGVGATVQNYKIEHDKIEFLVYKDAPLTSGDAEWTFKMFFIPVNKTLKNIDINCEIYPDRVY